MKEPVAKTKAAPVPKKTEVNEVWVLARFYRRMKAQHVYPLVVELQGASGAGLTAPVFINPVIPGAQIMPQEQTLDPNTAGAKATFYVTPLAKGTLPGARLDVFYQGRLVQEIPLRLRAVTQRLTWFLLALTVLVPAFLLCMTVYHPLTGHTYVPVKQPTNTPAEPGKDGAEPGKDGPAKELLNKSPKEEKEPLDGEEEQNPAGGNQDQPAQTKPRQRGSGGPTPPEPEALPEKVRKVPLTPGQVLEQRIKTHVPDLPSKMTVPWSEEPVNTPFTITNHVAYGFGEAYTYADNLKEDHFSFWIGVLFLALTITSAVTHRAARGRRRSQPLSLTSAGR